MAFTNLMQVSDWKLTSLGGMSLSLPMMKPLSLGVSAVPMEFTNSKTGLVRTFTGKGITASVGLGSSKSKVKLLPWLTGKFSASFSPSTFPSSGEVITMLAARDPFYIDSLRGYWGQMVSGGIGLGPTGSLGAIVFTIIPPSGLFAFIADAAAIAVCFFSSSGLGVGSLASAGADVFTIS